MMSFVVRLSEKKNQRNDRVSFGSLRIALLLLPKGRR